MYLYSFFFVTPPPIVIQVLLGSVTNKHVLNWTKKSIKNGRKGHNFLLAQYDKQCLCTNLLCVVLVSDNLIQFLYDPGKNAQIVY